MITMNSSKDKIVPHYGMYAYMHRYEFRSKLVLFSDPDSEWGFPDINIWRIEE